MRRSSLGLAAASLLLGLVAALGCGAAGSSSTTAELDRHDTGKGCAPASFFCEPGRCAATIDNQCETPVTCQLKIVSQCHNVGGDVGPANAATKKVTQLSKTKSVLEAATQCGQGTAVITSIDSLTCF
ncbi:MAG: hypothetical protein IPM79_33790 [Polyangiaceae bacterium]|jgi:hypothetical protein|nr:hypothetical protein [Polyangiaceae bacterium]MBK8942437.1 hypothetical protein [Polyangiaceae bacterium]